MMSRYGGRGFYDPLSEMNRLLSEVFGGFVPRRSVATTQAASAVAWSPSIDVLHRDGNLVIRAELPGAKPEDVDVTVHNGLLTISGKLEEERKEERRGYLVRERRFGSFQRSPQLPQDVDEDAINARFEDGVLEVTIPGAIGALEPKRIQVEAGERPAGTESAGVRTEAPTRTETTWPVASEGTPEPRDVPLRTEQGREVLRRRALRGSRRRGGPPKASRASGYNPVLLRPYERALAAGGPAGRRVG